MDNYELASVRSEANSALARLAPLVEALQGANKVFDVLYNAQVHKEALERDVADLQAAATDAQARRASWDEMTALSMQRATDAEVEATARVEKAVTDADTTVQGAHDAMTVQIAEAQVEATDALQGIAKHVQEARAEHDSAMLQMEVARLAAQAEFDTLDKKLTALRANAQKFADALAG
jgi:predicted  nucleic acid-binding Zn-ribbon protein